MIPYYILKIKRFNCKFPSYCNQSQLAINGLQDDHPKTEFIKQPDQKIQGYTKYDLICEKLEKRKGRAYGNNKIFDQIIFIYDSTIYNSLNSDLLIMNVNKEVFKKFYNDFKEDINFCFEKIDINFEYIIHNSLSLGIHQIWLGQLGDLNIDALMLLGHKIENSSRYKQLVTEGAEIKNIALIYAYNKRQIRIMITKEGGIIFYDKVDETDALLIVEDIYSNLLKST